MLACPLGAGSGGDEAPVGYPGRVGLVSAAPRAGGRAIFPYRGPELPVSLCS